MKELLEYPFWLELLGVLALEASIVVGLAALLQWRIASAVWRRTLWQTSLLGLLLLALFELTGVGHGVADWIGWTSRTNSASSAIASREDPTLSSNFREEVKARVIENRQAARPKSATVLSPKPLLETEELLNSHGSTSGHAELSGTAAQSAGAPITNPGGTPEQWIGLIWFVGAALILGRTSVRRLLFFALRLRHRSKAAELLYPCVEELARRLRFRRTVRVVEFPCLSGPIAFGVFRPTIGLPKQFTANFNQVQQKAMLAHELAHLSGHDPAWHVLSNLITAIFWWHPLVWWARGEMFVSSEAAADEASVMIDNGPSILAECLVELGVRLSQPRSLGWIGIQGNGFRSSLGRRVERLMNLQGQIWYQPSLRQSYLVRTLGPIALIGLTMLSTAWTRSESAAKGEVGMKTLERNWRHSLAAFALATALNGNADAAGAPGIGEETSRKPQAAAVEKRSGRNQSAAGGDSRDPAFWVRPGAVDDTKLLNDGRLLYELGRIDDAVEKFRQALKMTPDNKAAAHYLAQAKGAEAADPASNELLEEETPEPAPEDASPKPRFEIDPRMAERYGLIPPGKRNATASITKPRSERLEAKLREITFREAPPFDGLPLGEVIKFLTDQSRKLDAEKQGINFIINNSLNARTAESRLVIDPNTGVPIPAPTPEPMDLNSVSIRLPKLRNVRMRDMLDAITKVADRPVKFSIEPYAVVFSPSDSPLSSVLVENEDPKPFFMDPRMIARYFGGKLPPGHNNITATNSTDGHRGAVQSKLEQITFKETPAFDGLPLSEIIRFIDEKSRNLDPASEGINFIFSNSLDAPPANSATSIDPNTGLPIRPPVIEPIEVRNTIVRLPSLRNLQLKDLLDAVCKVADQPIKYTVEQYGVIFSRNPVDQANVPVKEALRASDSELPQVRTFRIDRETLLAGLESAFGISLSDQSGGGGAGGGGGRGGGRGGGGRGSDRSTQARDIQDSLQRVLSQLGLNLNGTNKALVYNELTGILLVRATDAELKIAEAAIETLGGTKIDQSRPGIPGGTSLLKSDASTDQLHGTTKSKPAGDLQTELERTEEQLKAFREVLRPQHPKIRALTREIEKLKENTDTAE